MVLESGLLQERDDRYEVDGSLPPLAIPATLHDSLMARLDRLATVKGLAQLGATLGREFAYDLCRPSRPGTRRRNGGCSSWWRRSFCISRGRRRRRTSSSTRSSRTPPINRCCGTRQQYHQRIAQVLEARFPELCETQPELLAHHYTEAGLMAQAVPYWQRACQRATERSANLEAVAHLTRGLRAPATLPDTPERAQQELIVQTTLGPALMATKGYSAPGCYKPTPGLASSASRWVRRRSSSRCCEEVVNLPAPGGVTDGARTGGATPDSGPACQ